MAVAKVCIVNGVDYAPHLSKMKVHIMDLDSEDTSRNAEGTMTRDRIATKHKIELLFGALTPDALAVVLTAVKPKEVPVTYTDPETGTTASGQFYAGDRDDGESEGADRTHYDVAFNLTEL